FGRGRAGTNDTLRTLCAAAGISFTEVPPVTHGGEPVSSSRVRAAIVSGDVARAAELLGRPYRISGTVVTGAKRGRTIGFPTANLGDVPTVLPGNGVYAVRATVRGQAYPAAANVGPNPTFGEDARKVEVHLIRFSGDVYGEPLAVEFVTKLRAARPAAPPVSGLDRDVELGTAELSGGSVSGGSVSPDPPGSSGPVGTVGAAGGISSPAGGFSGEVG